MKKLFLFLALALVIALPTVADAHRSGCHRWHSCPSDTGSYNVQTSPTTGKTIPYCGKSMYLGIDERCHYYTTPNAPAPAVNLPSVSVPSTQANVSQADQAKIQELQRQLNDLLKQVAALQAQIIKAKR